LLLADDYLKTHIDLTEGACPLLMLAFRQEQIQYYLNGKNVEFTLEQSFFPEGKPSCLICWTELPGIIILPCSHIYSCKKCVIGLNTCILCKKRIVCVTKAIFCWRTD
jgi:hypothetical protein